MKGLRKVLTPFAPDQSGAASVLYEMGGLTVIMDAGGCTGNIGGFDEPRSRTIRSAVFSAGLRDMDAIFGRDKELIEKLVKAVSVLDVSFAALIGTPVPAVIGTDLTALARMAERETGLPVLPIPTTGLPLYDKGIETALSLLFSRFAKEGKKPQKGNRLLGVLGLTPLDFPLDYEERILKPYAEREGFSELLVYGSAAGITGIERAGEADVNLVVSPAGVKAAEALQERFGTPYRIFVPFRTKALSEAQVPKLTGKKVLLIHQQVFAETLRAEVLARGAASVDAASWFMMRPEMMKEEDIRLKEEDDLTELTKERAYDVIFADPCLAPLVSRASRAEMVPLPHFALSGTGEQGSYL